MFLSVVGGSGNFASADPTVYEPGLDPAPGFNFVSWSNFGANGANVWTTAVQDAYNAGFREVSLSPLRFVQQQDTGDPANISGTIPVPTSGAPSLSHVQAGVVRAKQLGMTVTVNPFIEMEGFRSWRGQYNPSGTQATRFWTAYQGYMTEVAQMAQATGADRMNVGTELKALTGNSGFSDEWNSVINAVAANYTGMIGYAANWDEYKNGNTTSSIWDHPAVDFMGVDAYFPMATNAQSDASGANPNPAFINTVRDGWNHLLDDVHSLNPSLSGMVDFAEARHGGAGLPIVFTESGYLPYNRSAVQHGAVQSPDNPPAVVDQDEQIMGFNGLLQALDHRRADDNFLAMHVWQWSMPGSNGSLWNMFPSNAGDQDLNVPATQFLSNFVSNPLLPPSYTADFDGNGSVGASDLNNWQTGFGMSGVGVTRANGDADGDLDVDGDDFQTWQRQLGSGVPVAAGTNAVPEPTSLALLTLVCGLFARLSRESD